MIDFVDRVYSGKKTITYEDGTKEIVTIENAEDATVDGTPINRYNMMAAQGFITKRIFKNDDGSVVETNENGETLTIRKNPDGSITEVFVGEKTITKTTKKTDGMIIEEVS